jgi:orotate phosphoribosyltransferase
MFTHDQIWRGIDRLANAFGYSPSGLARQAGLDPTSFNKSKRISRDGKARWPSTESISKILAVTGATMSDFFDLIEADDPSFTHALTTLSTDEIAKRAAMILLDTESVLFNAKEPFVLKSGRPSPVYIDCRRLISFVRERKILMDFGAALLEKKIGAKKIDYVAGGETAGIPYGAFIAERLQKPMLYVRKESKGYGRMAQIEGVLPEKGRRNVVLVEDLQTDGGSKKIFVDALRKAGANVEHAFVVFHYGIFPASEKNMKKMGLTLHALTTWWSVLEVAKEGKYFDTDTLNAVEDFLSDPEHWGSKKIRNAKKDK